MDFGLGPAEEAEVEIRQSFELDDFGESAAVDAPRELAKQLEKSKQ